MAQDYSQIGKKKGSLLFHHHIIYVSPKCLSWLAKHLNFFESCKWKHLFGLHHSGETDGWDWEILGVLYNHQQCVTECKYTILKNLVMYIHYGPICVVCRNCMWPLLLGSHTTMSDHGVFVLCVMDILTFMCFSACFNLIKIKIYHIIYFH